MNIFNLIGRTPYFATDRRPTQLNGLKCWKDEYGLTRVEDKPGSILRLGIPRMMLSPWMKQYRYMHPDYAKLFFETGSLKINTVFDCHGLEQDESCRGDPNDGIYQFIDSVGQLTIAPIVNQWVLCTSTSPEKSVKERFGGGGFIIEDTRFFHEISRFLQRKVKRQLFPSLIINVEYRDLSDKNPPLREGEFYGRIKDRATFSWQHEVRALWEVIGQDNRISLDGSRFISKEGFDAYIARQKALVPQQIIRVPDARRYCTLLA